MSPSHPLPYDVPAPTRRHSPFVIPAAGVLVELVLLAATVGVFPAVGEPFLHSETLLGAVAATALVGAGLSLSAALQPNRKCWLAVVLLLLDSFAAFQCWMIDLFQFHMPT